MLYSINLSILHYIVNILYSIVMKVAVLARERAGTDVQWLALWFYLTNHIYQI